MNSLDFLLSEASSFVQSEFHLEVKKSKLKPYSPKNWNKFCQVNKLNGSSEGVYIPTSYSAYVRTDSPVLKSNIFHELYGHGLFIEHSHITKKLIDIIQSKGDENLFMDTTVNSKEQPYGLCKTNRGNYEGFAVWLEALLCEETNNSTIWQQKKDRLPKEYISLFEFFQHTEQKLSRFGFMSQLGFPKVYNNSKVLEVIRNLYGNFFNNIEYIILYGSQKPESDIDLLVISNNQSINYFNGWLDIYELNRNEFKTLSTRLDISVTDPLFTGSLIYGNKNSFEQLKQHIQNQSITQEAIRHNFSEAKKQKKYLQQFSETDKRRKDCTSYSTSFYQNAKQLTLGNKPLTLKKLQQTYTRQFSRKEIVNL